MHVARHLEHKYRYRHQNNFDDLKIVGRLIFLIFYLGAKAPVDIKVKNFYNLF